jgi:hypothetical protein
LNNKSEQFYCLISIEKKIKKQEIKLKKSRSNYLDLDTQTKRQGVVPKNFRKSKILPFFLLELTEQLAREFAAVGELFSFRVRLDRGDERVEHSGDGLVTDELGVTV